MVVYNKLYEKLDALYERLDNLEGCEDNPVYAREIFKIRAEINDIINTFDTGFF